MPHHQQDAKGMQKEIWRSGLRKLWVLSQCLFVQPLFLVPTVGSARSVVQHTLMCAEVSAEDKAEVFTVTDTSTAGSKRGEFQSQTRPVRLSMHPTIHPPTFLKRGSRVLLTVAAAVLREFLRQLYLELCFFPGCVKVLRIPTLQLYA